MAKKYVWGIDIGNAALKALRCHADENNPSRLIADTADYIEYPMMLTQPDANPDELIHDALKEFLSRNSVRGDAVFIGVSGQMGLVRYIKLPPVDPKKIPDIVQYEAKQQIPLKLTDVIWDYQRLGKDSESSLATGLEVEIGLFAMKRDQVFHTLEPYENAGVNVDCVQLAPLALYNYLTADELGKLPDIEDYDPENPPPYVVLLSMGTDATDLILTNGFRVWQRNLAIGGNHFTKAITKEMKLTFAKAEHLKRNVAVSQDKVAVFKAMQPAFNNILREVENSLGFYSNMDRHAKYERIIALGGPMKLTGLTRYLTQNLGIEVILGDSFTGLDTSGLFSNAAIMENLPSFGVCYGLCLQGVRRATLTTNLIPREILRERLINEKKPWAITAMSLLLLGTAISYGAQVAATRTVDDKIWKPVENAAVSIQNQAKDYSTQLETAKAEITSIDKVGKDLVMNVEKRLIWIELLRGINECLPKEVDVTEEPTPESIRDRQQLHIVNIEAQRLPEKDAWIKRTAEWRPKNPSADADDAAAESGSTEAASTASQDADDVAVDEVDSQEGGNTLGAEQMKALDSSGVWLISISGYHFHNGDNNKKEGADFVNETFIKNIREKKFSLPKPVVISVDETSSKGNSTAADNPNTSSDSALADANVSDKAANGEDDGDEMVTMEDLGVSEPTLINPSVPFDTEITNPYAKQEEVPSGVAHADSLGARSLAPQNSSRDNQLREDDSKLKVKQFNFVVHFLWEPKTPSQRALIRAQKEEAAKKAAEEAAAEKNEVSE